MTKFLASIIALLFCASAAFAAELPAGFLEEKICDGLNAVTAMVIAPDGRVFICEQTGKIKIVKDARLLPDPAVDLSERLDSYWERGLIGIALDPEFPAKPFVYLNQIMAKPFPHHRISRFRVDGDHIVKNDELILLEGDDQTKIGGPIPAGHQGGPMRFGPDGKLYIALGEQTAGDPSQRLDTLLGKILRINSDGSIPSDNPFFSTAAGKYRAIWAYGLRNPFGLAFQPATARLFEDDVGQSSWEEINEIQKGRNYGWPKAEGFSTNKEFANPVHAYPPAIGRSITGGVFYNPQVAQFPSQYIGKYFFLDYMAHWLRVLDPQNPTNVTSFARNFNGPVAVELAPDGSLFVLNRAAWVRDDKFTGNSGSLVRIKYNGEVEQQQKEFADRLSRTDLFDSLEPFKPARDFVGFELNAPVWRPGVEGRFWIRVPEGKKISFHEQGEWYLPAGTVVIQHYSDSRQHANLETQIIETGEAQCSSAANYRWNEPGHDASLMDEMEIIRVKNTGVNWFSPGSERCVNLRSTTAGFIVQINTRQLNREMVDSLTGTPRNQLLNWSERGFFDRRIEEQEILRLPRLASISETDAPVELRARSYLDANCAVCHHPEGPARGFFDARFDTPLQLQKTINGDLMAGDLGIKGARVLLPGSPEKSILYQRLKHNDFFRMPPVAVNDLPSPALSVIEQWISGLKAD